METLRAKSLSESTTSVNVFPQLKGISKKKTRSDFRKHKSIVQSQVISVCDYENLFYSYATFYHLSENRNNAASFVLLQNKHQIYIYKTCFEHCVEYTWEPACSLYFILTFITGDDLLLRKLHERECIILINESDLKLHWEHAVHLLVFYIHQFSPRSLGCLVFNKSWPWSDQN